MTDKHFHAILAKNNIARELSENKPENISYRALFTWLKDIEQYIGQANQPCVDDIINSEIEI